MKRSDWKSGDPPGSEKPRGKSAYRRKGSRDGGAFTPSEKRQKDALMRQFLKRDGQQGNSEAFKRNYDRINWGARVEVSLSDTLKAFNAFFRETYVAPMDEAEARLKALGPMPDDRESTQFLRWSTAAREILAETGFVK